MLSCIYDVIFKAIEKFWSDVSIWIHIQPQAVLLALFQAYYVKWVLFNSIHNMGFRGRMCFTALMVIHFVSIF